MLSFVYAAAASYVRPTSTSAPGEVSAIAKTLASSPPQFASPSTSLPSTPGASTSSQSTPSPKSPIGPLSAANLSSRPLPQSVDRYAVIHDVLRQEDLYGVLGVPKSADLNAMRRAYMARCKCCHPE
ncbi:hypothetical protein FRC02_007854 [Tulasnella sp. 418]|nr:hypothetical protein FRC02_007854 [Tulasnella sp. 418]